MSIEKANVMPSEADVDNANISVHPSHFASVQEVSGQQPSWQTSFQPERHFAGGICRTIWPEKMFIRDIP